MKKERIILFPGHKESSAKKMHPDTLLHITPGKAYRIGKPSNRYYEHLHPTLEPGRMTVKDFEDFRIIKDMIVIVSSILRMTNGARIAVLRRYDDTCFMNKIKKIFLTVDMGLASGELIALDLETERMLGLNAS